MDAPGRCQDAPKRHPEHGYHDTRGPEAPVRPDESEMRPHLALGAVQECSGVAAGANKTSGVGHYCLV